MQVRLVGAAQDPRLNAAVHPLEQHKGSSSATFVATQAQTYSVAVSVDGYQLAGSPHTLLVKPAALCGAMSTVDGAGVSAASVAPRTSAFTIQAVSVRCRCSFECLDVRG